MSKQRCVSTFTSGPVESSSVNVEGLAFYSVGVVKVGTFLIRVTNKLDKQTDSAPIILGLFMTISDLKCLI